MRHRTQAAKPQVTTKTHEFKISAKLSRKNREGFRKCSACKIEKPLISDNFCSDKNRLSRFSYRCKSCDKAKKDNRKQRYRKLPEEAKEKYKAKNRAYTSSGLGRATAMVCAYRKYDRKRGMICDLDRDFMVNEIFSKQCFYCDDEGKMGCDRKDNKLGHLKSNVVPCCTGCNTTRMHNYTHEEMIVLGKVIKEIKQKRKEGKL